MRLSGLVVIIAAILMPLLWFYPLFNKYDTIPLFSQYLGTVGLITMALTQLLATRIKTLQVVFGAYDRIYVLHKWLGLISFCVILLHNTIGADIADIKETFFSAAGKSLGGTVFSALQLFLLITVITLIPYRFWRMTHRWIGLLYILAVVHFFLVPKAFSLTSPLGFYLIGFCLIGILSYLYSILPLTAFKSPSEYTVNSITKTGSALAIDLHPRNKELIRYRAGQFAFISFDAPDLQEAHPFTISKAPTDDGNLRFTIKPRGHYTNILQDQLDTHITATVRGPYGYFTQPKVKRPQIWIAAGIGITPFLAWLQAIVDLKHPIYIFYSVSELAEVPHRKEIQTLVATHKNIHLTFFESKRNNKLTIDTLISATATYWPNIDVCFCGPKPMQKEFMNGLKQQGLSRSRFHYEVFELRTGIGIDKALAWTYQKLVFHFPSIMSKTNSFIFSIYKKYQQKIQH
jgi:predicted ferric reductase